MTNTTNETNGMTPVNLFYKDGFYIGSHTRGHMFYINGYTRGHIDAYNDVKTDLHLESKNLITGTLAVDGFLNSHCVIGCNNVELDIATGYKTYKGDRNYMVVDNTIQFTDNADTYTIHNLCFYPRYGIYGCLNTLNIPKDSLMDKQDGDHIQVKLSKLVGSVTKEGEITMELDMTLDILVDILIHQETPAMIAKEYTDTLEFDSYQIIRRPFNEALQKLSEIQMAEQYIADAKAYLSGAEESDLMKDVVDMINRSKVY